MLHSSRCELKKNTVQPRRLYPLPQTFHYFRIYPLALALHPHSHDRQHLDQPHQHARRQPIQIAHRLHEDGQRPRQRSERHHISL
jgi:hypothetical protein